MDDIIFKVKDENPSYVFAKLLPNLQYDRAYDLQYYAKRNAVFLLYNDYADIITVAGNTVMHCIAYYKYDGRNIIFIRLCEDRICQIAIGKETKIIRLDDYYKDLVHIDAVIPEDTILQRVICKVINECQGMYRRTIVEYIRRNGCKPPKCHIEANVPSKHADLYKEILTSQDHLKTDLLINDGVVKPVKHYVDKLQFANLIHNHINIDKYNTADNASKYWNVMRVEIPIISYATAKTIKPVMKELLKFVKFYLIYNGIIDEQLMKYLKVGETVITKDKVLVITIMYKGDDKMVCE